MLLAAAIAAVGIAAPASWAAAAPPAAAVAPSAIDEGMFVDINGVEQWITIRGSDRRNPVLLFLHGGPGIGSASMAPIFAEWEKSFTIVQWDQPGGGGTDLKNIGKDIGPMTVARFTRDGLSVAQYALDRLHQPKLTLMGSSWGTLIGLEMVHARPDLFSAYVGTSQAVGDRGNRLGWEMAIEAARTRGDTKAVAELQRVGPPPYKSIQDLLVRQTYVFPPGLPMTPQEAVANEAFMKVITAPPPPGAHYVAPVPAPADYNPGMVFVTTQMKTFDETWHWEARHLGTHFNVPMFIFQGGHDLNTPVQAAREYFDEIQAPHKVFEIVPGAGHNLLAFNAELLALLKKDVLPVLAQHRQSNRR
jgi:pimeloyl-ACP methyl ester carboxylesterase